LPTHWTHITLTVSDVERSIEFYSSFCDLAVLKDRRKEGGGTVWLGPTPAPGKLPTFLLVIGQGDVSFIVDHLGFQCDSREEVDNIAERGKKLEILVLPPTDSGGVVGYWTMIKDPDGHLVEFTYGQPIEGLR
jgi:catechol 2,3-dioxygenase-like lactoylglutathione lyase family enzyme